MITQFPVQISNQSSNGISDKPRFDEMCNGEEDTEHDTKTANHNVGDAQEVVLASHD